ncbi:hypothetical protein WT83_04820 [Burkholderia territorii]|uniref:EAL domain-containing protein n=1 Tax=Burkholderia territorii TaxID=1503055 RepID=A0A108F2Q7_9BURK|nr:EAL domain-containing protein [Burkholderia territorii]KWN21998.1 hypothetical protein WT83_04820 [Burkholderia territorii]
MTHQSIRIEIRNLAQMAQVFGVEAMHQAVQAFDHYVRTVWCAPHRVRDAGEGEWVVELEGVTPLDSPDGSVEIGLDGWGLGGVDSVWPGIAVSMQVTREERGVAPDVDSASHIELARSDEAVPHLSAEMDFSRVHHIDSSDMTAFYLYPPSVLSHVAAADMSSRTPPRRIDHVRVLNAVQHLQAHPGIRLSVALNEQSIGIDAHWQSLWAQLEGAPEVAVRLMIEIPEGAHLAPGQGRSFVNRFRQLGCQIVVGDFGIHYGADVLREIPEPDWIVLDASRWGNWMNDARVYHRLSGMVALAHELASYVVIRSVNVLAMRTRLREAGVSWVSERGAV